jgi:predicted secreted protein
MRRAVLGWMLLAPLPALAQGAPPPTVLRLAETAEVMREPDELVATLRAEARGASAAAVQEAVNRSIAQALDRVRAVPSVRVATGGYWTSRVEDGRAWSAQQQITLTGRDAAPLLELVGQLQGGGLAASGLAWRLSREATQAARQEAARLALEGVQRRAEDLAAQMNLRVLRYAEIRVDVPERGPAPRMAMEAAPMAARAATPPRVVAEEVAVSATVAADAVLGPRS